MPLFDELEIFYELKHNMQFLDSLNGIDLDKKEGAYEDALENFLDAYLLYSKKNKTGMDWIVGKLKEQLGSSLKFKTDSEKEVSSQVVSLQKLLSSPELSSLQSEKLAKEMETYLQSVTLECQLDEKLEQLSDSQPVSLTGLEKLIKEAEKHASKEKKEASQQKSEKNKYEKLKNVVVESLRARLEKKSDKTEDEQYMLSHLDEIIQAEMVEKKGYKYLRTVFPGDRAFDLRFWNYKGKNGYVFSSDGAKDKSKVTEIYELTEAGETLAFQSTPAPEKKKKTLTVKDKDFRKRLSVPQLNEKQEKEFASELSAYNVYISSGQQDKAQQLLNLLTEKYNALSRKEKKQLYQEQKLNLQKIRGQKIKAIEKSLIANIQAFPDAELLNVFAPGRGNNKDEKDRRQKFNQILQIFSSGKKSQVDINRQYLVNLMKEDVNLWSNVSENYYKNIKRQAEDNYYKTMTEDLFSGKKNVNEVINANKVSLSPEVTRLILIRSIELHALAKDTVVQKDKMNELLKELGHHIRLEEFTVTKSNQLKSKSLTAILRCLADGRKLDLGSEQSGLDARDQKYIRENYAKLKELFKQEPNFQQLIGDVIEKKDSGIPLSLTPYQKRYKTLGLLAALEMSKKNEAVENEVFSQVTGTPNNTMLNITKQKAGWNIDDYLFANYILLFFDKEVDLSNKAEVQKLKNVYKWQEFKNKNKKASEQLADEFSTKADNPTKLLAGLLVEGKMAGATVHHNKPLKYAISSENPNEYNNKDNLAITMQWNAWEDDNHQMEHFTTLEGIEAGNPYLVKTEKGYVRRAQCDLHEGDVICYEKPQVKVGGRFQDFIPDKTLFLSSTGLIITSPEVPDVSLSLNRQVKFSKDNCCEL